ncbi:MAG: hypothetical protein RR444_09975 [Oscillospiraceae bacterium]
MQVCPTAALSKIGEEYTVEQVMGRIKRDHVFYRNSGGGVTLSGDEPLLQHGFAYEVFVFAKKRY